MTVTRAAAIPVQPAVPAGASVCPAGAALPYVRRSLLLYHYGGLNRPDPAAVKPEPHPQADPDCLLHRTPTLQCWSELGPLGSPQLPLQFYQTSLWLKFDQAACITLPGLPCSQRGNPSRDYPYGRLPPFTETLIAELLAQPDPPDLIALQDPELNRIYTWAATPNSRYRIIRAARRSGTSFLELPLGLPVDDPATLPAPWLAEQQTARSAREARQAQDKVDALRLELAELEHPPHQIRREQRQEKSRRLAAAAELLRQLEAAEIELPLLLREMEYWPARAEVRESPARLADLIRKGFLPEHAAQVQETGLLGLHAGEKLIPSSQGDPTCWLRQQEQAVLAQHRRAVWQYEYRRLQAWARELNPQHQEVPPVPLPRETPHQSQPQQLRNRVTVPSEYREALHEQLQRQAEWQQARSAGAGPVELIRSITREIQPQLAAARNRTRFALADARTNVQAYQQAGDADAGRYWKEQAKGLRRTVALQRQFVEYWASRLAEQQERIRAEHAAHNGSWPPPAPRPLPPGSSASGCEGWLQAGLTFRPDCRQPGNFLVQDAASGVSMGHVERHTVNRAWYYRYCSPQGQLQDSHTDWEPMKDYIIHQTERINKQALNYSILYTAAPPYPALDRVSAAAREARLEPADYAAAVMERLNLTLIPLPRKELPAAGPSVIPRLADAASGAVRWQLERETARMAAGDPTALWHAARPAGIRERISRTFAEILDYALTQELAAALSKRPAALERPPARMQPSPPNRIPAPMESAEVTAAYPTATTSSGRSLPDLNRPAGTSPAVAKPARQLILIS